MKSNLKYIKKFLKVIFWPIIFTFGQFLINYIFVCIFNNKLQLSNNELVKYINTSEYKEILNNYINSKALLIILLISIIYIPLFYYIYKKNKINNNFTFKNIVEPILYGISISLIFNIVIFSLNKIFLFTNQFEISNISMMEQIICSGIIGPILEELVFRGIVYNNLKKFNKINTSVILTGIIFALFHDNIINIIYAFIVNFVLIYLYEKNKTLKAPILMHITLNITIILMLPLITYNFIYFNLYILIICILILLTLLKVKKNFNFFNII